jgi:Domain of unknown function (DUF4272)
MTSSSDRQQYPTVSESVLQGIVRTSLDSPQPTPAQLERKAKTKSSIVAMELPWLEFLPVIEDTLTIVPRSVREIANRAICVCITAVKGEGLEQETVMEIVENLKISDLFTSKERVFIDDNNPNPRDRAKFSWRYECLTVLLWALGYKDTIPPAHEVCDVPTDVNIIQSQETQLAENSQLRSISEILDMADLYYRLHWAAIELRLKNVSNSYIDEGLIVERHYALNWLIRYMNQEWDDITTDT